MNETPLLRATLGRPRVRPVVATGPLPPPLAGAAASPDAPLDLDPDALQKLARAAVNDDALADFTSESPPLLTVDDKAGLPISPDQFRIDVVTDAVEIMAALARDRFAGPSSRRAENERRILELADAVLAAGEGCVTATLASWRQASSSEDPWKTWAPAFTLATLDGEASLSALLSGLEGLPPSALAHAAVSGEAIALVPRQDLALFDARLATSKHPLSRAVQLDLRVRSGRLPESALLSALSDPEPAVADSALRALDRMEPVPAAAAELVHALLAHPSRAVAWRAARALLLRADPRPLDAVRAGHPLASHLGPLALELFVLAGTAADLPIMDTLLSTMKATPAVLSAIARFGHPRSFAFLAFSLQDPSLSEAAAQALESLFGAIVPPAERRRPEAWSRAVAALRVDPDTRLRRGRPWSPSSLAAEIQTGTLSRPALAACADELRCRAGVTARLDLAAWGPDFTEPLGRLARAATAADASSVPGSWAAPRIPGVAR